MTGAGADIFPWQLQGADWWIMNVDGSDKRRLTFMNVRGDPQSVGRFRLAGSLSFVSDTAFFGDVMTQSLGLVGKIVRVDCGPAALGARGATARRVGGNLPRRRIVSPVGGPVAAIRAARVRRTCDKGERDMILLIAIVLGALVGAAASGEAGALAGALFGWLIVRSLRQQREIEALRKGADAPVRRRRGACARERASIEPDSRRRCRLPRRCRTTVTPDAELPAPAASASRRCRRRRVDERVRLRRRAPPRRADPTAVAPSSAAAARATVQSHAARGEPPATASAPRRRATSSRRSGAGCSAATPSSRPASASSSSASPFSPSTRASTRTCRSNIAWPRIGAAAVVLLGFGWRLRLARARTTRRSCRAARSPSST